MTDKHEVVVQNLIDLYHMLVCHNGFGEMSVDIRILKRGQKEVINKHRTPQVKAKTGLTWAQALVVLFVVFGSPLARAQEEMPSRDEMWDIIQEQANEIKELKQWRSRVNRLEEKASSSERKMETLDGTVRETGERLESVVQATESSLASQVRDVGIGGYGELHYNNLRDQHGVHFGRSWKDQPHHNRRDNCGGQGRTRKHFDIPRVSRWRGVSRAFRGTVQGGSVDLRTQAGQAH